MKSTLKKIITSNKNTLFDIALILLLGLLPLTWFKKNLLIYGTDFSFPLVKPLEVLNNYFYAWNSINAPGTTSMANFTQIPFYIIIVFLNYFGFSLLTIEKIYFVIFFTSFGLSMYYLTSTLVPGDKKRVASLTSAFFYMLNPFSMNIIWHRLLLVPLYAALPFILALFIKGLREGKFLFYSLLIGFISIFVSGGNTNPTFALAPIFVGITYFMFYLFKKRKERPEIIKAVKFTGLLMLVLIGLNMWWLLPRTPSISTDFTQASVTSEKVGLNNFNFLELNSRASSLLNVFRLQGYWAFYDAYKGDPYYTYTAAFATPPLQLVGFLIPILAFAMLLKKQKNLYILYFIFLASIGLFLIKGLQPPLGKIFLWLFENFPLFEIFRNSFDKFGIIVAFSYAFLIGLTISSIYQFLKGFSGEIGKKIMAPIILIFISVILFGVYAFPMWNGEVISKGGKVIPQAHVEIPDYYYQANEWLKGQDTNFSILPLPLPKLFYAAYKWKYGYWGSYPVWLFSKPTMSTYTGSSYNFALETVELAQKKILDNLGKVLALLNVKYVVLHEDTNWRFVEGNSFWISTTSRRYDWILKNQRGVHLAKSFGNLDFYRNENYKPFYIYGASNVSLIKDDFDKTLKTVSKGDFEIGKSLLFFTDQLNSKQRLYSRKISQSNPKKEPRIKFESVSPTKKIVNVNSKIPFFLVFSESFHPGWKAYIKPVKSPTYAKASAGRQESHLRQGFGGQARVKSRFWDTWFRKPLPEEKHFQANGYANSWFIDKKGNYTIFLEFTPQRYFYWGLVISLTTLGLSLFFLLKNVNYNFRTKQN